MTRILDVAGDEDTGDSEATICVLLDDRKEERARGPASGEFIGSIRSHQAIRRKFENEGAALRRPPPKIWLCFVDLRPGFLVLVI